MFTEEASQQALKEDEMSNCTLLACPQALSSDEKVFTMSYSQNPESSSH